MTCSPRRARAALRLLCALMILALPACKNKKADPGLTQSGLRIPEHFKRIPADTPYVLANIELPPPELINPKIEAQFERGMKALDEVLPTYSVESGSPYESRSQGEQLFLAMFEEVRGARSFEDLERLGLNMRGHFSIYGMGLFPVLRMDLSSGERFEALVQRVEARYGEQLPTRTLDDLTFRYYGDEHFRVPMIVTDSEMIVGFSPTGFSDEMVRYATGKKALTASMYEDNRLLALNEQYGWLPYSSGYVDTVALTEALLKIDSTSLNARSLASIADDLPTVTPACREEYRALARSAPRAVFGTTELTRTRSGATFGLEVINGLPQRLQAIKASSPGYGTEAVDNALLAVTLGFGVDPLLNALRDEAERLAGDPFRCEDLTWINQSAEQFYFGVGMIPAPMRSMLGTSLVISNIDVDLPTSRVNDFQAMMVMNSSNPQSLFEALRLVLSDILTGVQLKPDRQPVAVTLPPNVMSSMPGLPTPMLMMSQQALSLSFGAPMQTQAEELIGQISQAPNPLLSIHYDIQRFSAIALRMMSGAGLPPEEMAMMRSSLGSADYVKDASLALDIKEGGFFMDFDATLNNADGAP